MENYVQNKGEDQSTFLDFKTKIEKKVKENF